MAPEFQQGTDAHVWDTSGCRTCSLSEEHFLEPKLDIRAPGLRTKHKRQPRPAENTQNTVDLDVKPPTRRSLRLESQLVVPHSEPPSPPSVFRSSHHPQYLPFVTTSHAAFSFLLAVSQSHDLDYPGFYDSLYRLVTPDMMHAKYRARFFRMVDLCLTSSHVPAYVVAAFLKRFSR